MNEAELGDSAEFCDEDSFMRGKLIGSFVAACLAVTVVFAAGSAAKPAANGNTGGNGRGGSG
jgi:hypothetical protein